MSLSYARLYALRLYYEYLNRSESPWLTVFPSLDILGYGDISLFPISTGSSYGIRDIVPRRQKFGPATEQAHQGRDYGGV